MVKIWAYQRKAFNKLNMKKGVGSKNKTFLDSRG